MGYLKYILHVILPYESEGGTRKEFAQRVVDHVSIANDTDATNLTGFMENCACKALDKIFYGWVATPLPILCTEFRVLSFKAKLAFLNGLGYTLSWETTEGGSSEDCTVQVLRIGLPQGVVVADLLANSKKGN